jgi:hypothetical protein
MKSLSHFSELARNAKIRRGDACEEEGFTEGENRTNASLKLLQSERMCNLSGGV